MYASKAMGARHLQCAAIAVPLSTRVLFSSVGSGLGNVGQANYAAGNACLDAHALLQPRCTETKAPWRIVGSARVGKISP